MRDTIEIREARLSDSTFIFGFICSLEGTEFDYIVFQRIFIENLENKHNIYLVAFANKEPVGFLSCHSQLLLHHNGRIGEIQELYIDNNFRSKRIGQTLLYQLEIIAIQRGFSGLEVTSNKKRLQAHRFYKKNGFKDTHIKFTKDIM